MNHDVEAEAPHDGRMRRSDLRIERGVGRVLQVGVLVAALVVSVGAASLLSREGGAHVGFQTFTKGPASLLTVRGILVAGGALDSRAIVQLGLVLLIATPVARVALTLVAFAVQRDRVYVAATGVVLALLVYGLLWGAA